MSSLPLINSLCGDLLNQEMNFFVENIAAQAHKKQGLLIFAGSVGGSEHSASQDNLASESSHRPASGNKHVGLFRGKSFLEHPLERYHAAVIRCVNLKKVKSRAGAVNSWWEFYGVLP